MADLIGAVLAVSSKSSGLSPVANCRIGRGTTADIPFLSLPELTTSKEVGYTQRTVIGRSSPILSYQSSGPRTIALTYNCHCLTKADMVHNLFITRLLYASLFPRYEAGYEPPPLVTISCGVMYPNVTCVVRSVEIPFSSDSVWDENLMVPRNWTLTASLEAVYTYTILPGHDDVMRGRAEIGAF